MAQGKQQPKSERNPYIGDTDNCDMDGRRRLATVNFMTISEELKRR